MPAKATERRITYNQRKEQGLCPRCGAKIKKKGKFIFCDDCRAFFRNYNYEYSENINELRKNRYEERKQLHQCPRCGKKLGKKYKKIMCQTCLDKNHKYNQK